MRKENRRKGLKWKDFLSLVFMLEIFYSILENFYLEHLSEIHGIFIR